MGMKIIIEISTAINLRDYYGDKWPVQDVDRSTLGEEFIKDVFANFIEEYASDYPFDIVHAEVFDVSNDAPHMLDIELNVMSVVDERDADEFKRMEHHAEGLIADIPGEYLHVDVKIIEN